MTRAQSRRITVLAAVVAASVVATAGCSSSKSSNASGSGSAANSGGTTQIAFLNASAANTWLASALTEMNKVAAQNNAKITSFDAGFKTGVQAGQIQTLLASKKYKGIIIASVDGAAVIPQLELAIKQGVQVAVLNQIVGTKLDTSDPQFPGAAASVLAPPLRSGQREGKLAIQACQGKAECGVVYFYGIKGSPIDTATKQGFDQTIAAYPNIKIVATAEGQYLGPEKSLKAMQDVLQTKKNFDVVVGADQSIQGVELALKDAKITGTKLIGFGGSAPALAGVASGAWFGDVFGAPQTEGKLATQALIEAIKTGKSSGGIDAGSTLPDDGLVTKANVSKFTAEWAG
jgi:ribose transport system substrate-binding protein